MVQARRLAVLRSRLDLARTRHLIELGGLVQKAGLAELMNDDCATMLGALLEVAENTAQESRCDMATWFTADTYFGHTKVLGGRRPRSFPFVAAMDATLVKRWNAVITPDDECWHLGDFFTYADACLEGVFHRLHGRKHLILGNHNEENDLMPLLDWWEPPTQQRMIRLDGRDIYLCHFPHATVAALPKRQHPTL